MKRLVSLAVSLFLLALIYWWIDLGEMLRVFAAADPSWLAASIAVMIPLTLLTAVRLRSMVPKEAAIGVAEATRLILAACVLNLFLPSKMGDLAKSWFFRQRGHLSGSLALALVVFEKSCDVLALLVWCAFGLTILPDRSGLFLSMAFLVAGGIVFGLLMLGSLRFAMAVSDGVRRLAPASIGLRLQNLQESWEVMHRYFWSDRRRLLSVAAMSLFIWLVNLLQVWMFIRALKAQVPVLHSLGLTPLSIFAGLLPFTIAGVGTRDIAVIFFYQEYFPSSTAAALGILLTARYVILAIAGLPFIGMMSRAR